MAATGIGVVCKRSTYIVSVRPIQNTYRFLCSVFGSFNFTPIQIRLQNNKLLYSRDQHFNIKAPFSCNSKFHHTLLQLCRLPGRRHHVTTSEPASAKNCWRCGRQLDLEEELFFCECGVVQKVTDDMTYFELFGFKAEFEIDVELLSKMHKSLQTKLHPDKFSQKSETERDFSVGQSALVNKAYKTLSKPLTRGLYLLELKGHPVLEDSMQVKESDTEFLMEIMDMNERLGEAESVTEIESVYKENNGCLEECLQLLSKAFKEGNIEQAKSILIKLQYYTNIDEKIKEVYRKEMDM